MTPKGLAGTTLVPLDDGEILLPGPVGLVAKGGRRVARTAVDGTTPASPFKDMHAPDFAPPAGCSPDPRTTGDTVPPILKFLCCLFGALNVAKMVTLGFNIAQSADNRSIVWAAGGAAIGLLLLFALLTCFSQRKRNSLALLRVVVAVIVVCQLIFFAAGWLTTFQDASPLLTFQQFLDWTEVITCIALSVVLRLHSTKFWFAAKQSGSHFDSSPDGAS